MTVIAHGKGTCLQPESCNKKAEINLFNISWDMCLGTHFFFFFVTLCMSTNDYERAMSIDWEGRVINKF